SIRSSCRSCRSTSSSAGPLEPGGRPWHAADVGITERLARACSRHPRRTYAAWAGVLVLSLAAVALLLRGLTTNATVTGSPESTRAAKLIARSFPPDPRGFVSEIVVVRSDRYAATAPEFRAFVERLAREGLATGKIMGG